MNKVTRGLAAAVVRRLPSHHRGRARLLDMLDARRGSADPLVVAPMKLGYRMKLDLRSRTEVFAYYTGDYDTELIAAACRLLPRDGIAVDVGANVGFWAVPLAQRGTAYAYEPVRSNADRLLENAVLNRVENSLLVQDIGLSNVPGLAKITLREDFERGASTGNAAIAIDVDDDRFEHREITLSTLDNEAQRLDLKRLDIVKLDIEGHEDMALLGARQTLARFRPVIWVEWNRSYYDRRGIDPRDAIALALDTLEYTFFRKSDGHWRQQDRFDSPRDLDDLVIAPAERAESIRRHL